MSQKRNILTIDYKDNRPLVSVTIILNGKPVNLDALADTGNSTALAIPKHLADELGFKEEDAISDEVEVTLADGTLVACFLYRLKCQIGIEEEVERIVYVPNMNRRVSGKSTNPKALLGRKILDSYQVVFDGTTSPKTLSFLQ